MSRPVLGCSGVRATGEPSSAGANYCRPGVQSGSVCGGCFLILSDVPHNACVVAILVMLRRFVLAERRPDVGGSPIIAKERMNSDSEMIRRLLPHYSKAQNCKP